MSKMDWFRSWHGAPTDNKWLVIARKANVAPGIVSAVAWALLDYASQHTDRGSVKDFDAETYATFAGFEEDTVAAIIAAMKAKNVIGPDDHLTNWDKRQPKREDDSKERVAHMRQKQALEAEIERLRAELAASANSVTPDTTDDVTQCNATEHDVTQCDAPEKNREDTDKDTDKEETIQRADGRGRRPTMQVNEDLGRACKAHESILGQLITPGVGDSLWDLLTVEGYSIDWIIDAMKIAKDAGKPTLKYTRGILQNWRTEGKYPNSNGNGKTPQLTPVNVPTGTAAEILGR